MSQYLNITELYQMFCRVYQTVLRSSAVQSDHTRSRRQKFYILKYYCINYVNEETNTHQQFEIVLVSLLL